MDDYEDIYYVDTRNADSRDHRRPGSPSASPWRPSPPPSRTVYVPQTGQPPMPVYAAPRPVYYQPQMLPQQSVAATLFGRLNAGQVIDMATQVIAALSPLPASPVSTREVSTDLANLTLFQAAVAEHVKRDERLRTLGNLIAKLVG